MSFEAAVEQARLWLGTPYRHQASTLGAGCDCLGLVRGVWRGLFGAEPWAVPPYGAQWRGNDGAALQQAADRFLLPGGSLPSAGHVVLFRMGRDRAPRHCGILLSPTRFVHAQERLGVVEADLTEGWRKRIAGLYEFPPRN